MRNKLFKNKWKKTAEKIEIVIRRFQLENVE